MPALPPLDKLDPADAWAPWKPDASDPWNRKWAAHLYRRAGFGASNEELATAAKRGYADTLALLLGGAPGADSLVATLNDTGKVAAKRDTDGTQIRGWHLYCMLQSGHPLRVVIQSRKRSRSALCRRYRCFVSRTSRSVEPSVSVTNTR